MWLHKRPASEFLLNSPKRNKTPNIKEFFLSPKPVLLNLPQLGVKHITSKPERLKIRSHLLQLIENHLHDRTVHEKFLLQRDSHGIALMRRLL